MDDNEICSCVSIVSMYIQKISRLYDYIDYRYRTLSPGDKDFFQKGVSISTTFQAFGNI